MPAFIQYGVSGHPWQGMFVKLPAYNYGGTSCNGHNQLHGCYITVIAMHVKKWPVTRF